MSYNKSQIFLIAGLLFLLNFITAFAFINEGLFHCDSVMLAQATEKTYATGRLHPSLNGRYGSVILNSILYLPFYLAGQNADFATRFSGILFHSLSIATLFLFVREALGSLRVAFFSALLFSFAPFYFVPNTYGKEHGAAMFFLLASFYLLLRGLNEKSFVLLSLAGISFVFSVSIRESMLAALPIFGALYLLFAGKFKAGNFAAWLLPLLAGLFLLYFTYLKGVISRTLFIKDTAAVYFLGINSSVFKLALSDLFTGIHPLVFVFSFFGAVKMFYDKKIFPAALFLSCFFLIFYFGNTSCYAARHLDLIAIPIFIFAAYLLSDIYLKYKWAAFLFILSFVLSMFLFIYPLLHVRHQYNGEKQFALYVNAKTENNAIIIAMDYAPFIEYYARRKAITYPIADKARINNFISEINGYLRQGIPVYLKDLSLSYDYSRGGLLEKSLRDNFNIIFVGRKLTEDFHRPELRFQFYPDSLLKIQLKKRGENVAG